jgi:hypothetical protein
MDNGIREILNEWKTKKLPDQIERETNPTIGQQILAITGPRRAGKTYLMNQLIKKQLNDPEKEHTAYIDFEDYRLTETKKDDLGKITKTIHELFTEKDGKITLLLDEIQRIPDWETWLRTLHNTEKYNIIISGSSSRLQAREIATALRGRYVSRLLLPFSFREFLKTKQHPPQEPRTREEEGILLRHMTEYVTYGGFPDVIKKDNRDEKIELLKVYYETIFYRDIIETHRIRNISAMEAFTKNVVSNFGRYLSLTKTEKYLRTLGLNSSKKTLANHLRSLESAFFVFSIEKLSPKLRERVQQPKKIYPIDPGFLNLTPRFTGDHGTKIECVTAIELLRRQTTNPLLEVYYWKDHQQKEVDFVIKEGTDIKELIQVCYDISDPDTKAREERALIKAAEDLRCSSLLVLTWDYESTEERKGKKIRYLPLWKWLLGGYKAEDAQNN